MSTQVAEAEVQDYKYMCLYVRKHIPLCKKKKEYDWLTEQLSFTMSITVSWLNRQMIYSLG